MRWFFALLLLAGCTAGGSSEQEFFERAEVFRDHQATGTYHCTKCGQPVFQSQTKLTVDSRWPVFSEPVAGAVQTQPWKEEGKLRHKVNCGGCHLHLGYLCRQGEIATGETGDQYCVLSSSLKFEPAAE